VALVALAVLGVAASSTRGLLRRIRQNALAQYSHESGSRRPFLGKPHQVPGLIEAEHYDLGPTSDPAYRDSTPGSLAPPDQRYRPDDVDVGGDPLLDLVDVAWVTEGEWLEYTLEVPRPGRFRIETRLATPENGRQFHFTLDGRPLTGPITAPNTGCWGSDLKGGHCFGTVLSEPFELPAGSHRLRWVAQTGGYTVDWFKLEAVTNAGPGVAR
jgi:hypothetical protein